MSDSENNPSSGDAKEEMETEPSDVQADVGAGGDGNSKNVAPNNDSSKHKPSEKGDGDDSEQEESAQEEEEEEKPAKKTNSKPEQEDPEEEESADEEEEPDRQKKGILGEAVVFAEGRKRERKKVERIEITGTTPKEEKPLVIPEGRGEKLGDMPRVEFHLGKTKAEDLKILHRLLFGKLAKPSKIKGNIRQFCGFSFSKDSSEYKAKLTLINKQTLPILKHCCDIVDTERGGTKELIVGRFMDFLMKPVASGRKVPEPKKKKVAKTTKKGTKRKRKTKSKEEKTKKTKKAPKSKAKDDSSDEEEEEEDSDEKSTDSDEENGSSSEAEESEDEAPKKKKQKVAAKKPAKKEAKKEKKKVSKPAKKATSKKAESVSASSDDDSSDDDEPLVTKKDSPPSNEEIKKIVKGILDDADLEEITMKKVCRQVYDKYPQFDLSDRKDFIKTTVKELIR